MKYEQLEGLSEKFVCKIRTFENRKTFNWKPANFRVILTAGEARAIGVYDFSEESSPLDEFDQSLEEDIFVAKVGNNFFLVNTEGFSYAQYFVQCVIVESPFEVDDEMLEAIVASAEAQSGLNSICEGAEQFPSEIEARVIEVGLLPEEVLDSARKSIEND